MDELLTGKENLQLIADLNHLGRIAGRARVDEPTTGLDPRSRRQMWSDIRDLAADGVTIFLTTQYLDEADELADRIAVLDRGRIVAEGTPDELKRRTPGGHVRLRFADSPALRAAAALFDGAAADEERLVLRVPGTGDVASLRRLRSTTRGSPRGALDLEAPPGRRLLRRDRPNDSP